MAGIRAAHIQTLRLLPERLRAAVAGLDDLQLDTPTAKRAGRCARWCITSRQPRPGLPPLQDGAGRRLADVKVYDEAAWAKLPDSRLPVDGSLALIEALHGSWVALLDLLTEEDFHKGFTHPERGRIDLAKSARHVRLARAPPHAHITGLRARRAGRNRMARALSCVCRAPGPAHRGISRRPPAAALLEDGRVLFDMRSARYAVSESHGRCLLELWSEERNLIRTVVEVAERAQCLRLATRRMGAAKPQTLELVPHQRPPHPHRPRGRAPQLSKIIGACADPLFIGSKVDGLRSRWTWSTASDGLCARTAVARHGAER